ncbi:SH3 domain-containing protein [Bacillus toyonensis]|uniref:SH3 domain-containing protein n=1 Tax=Bacillus toyonensis TaxID=155322 RepID=UPI002E1F79E7|nr:SH3 domain-containing protein [Bacillus toyonensis]
MKKQVVLLSTALMMAAPLVTIKADTFHTVKSGDTLWGISNQYKVSVSEIKSWNSLKSDIISSGQKLIVSKTNSSNNNQSGNQTSKVTYAKVTASALNLRSSINGPVVATMPNGAKVEVISKSNGWTQVKYGTKTGWASSEFLKEEAGSTTGGNNGNTGGTGGTVTPPKTPTYATVTASALNLRSSVNGPVVATMPNGTKVEVISKSNGWTQVKFGGKTGWASSEFLKEEANTNTGGNTGNTGGTGGTVTPPKTPTYATVTASALNLRSSVNGPIVTSMPKGTKVEVISKSNGWSQVKYGTKTGWASSEFLKEEAGSSTGGNNGNTGGTGGTVTPPKTPTYAKVTASALNLRSSINGPVVATMPNGAKVEVISKSNGWSQVKYGTQTGWASSEFLKEETSNGNSGGTVTPPKAPTYATVTASALNLRNSINGSVIATMPNGTRVEVISKSNGWSQVKYGTQTGWASSDFLREETDTDTGNNGSSNGKGKVVWLDAGHGGVDAGAVNGKYYEKDLTLSYSNKVKQKLEQMGYKVAITRNGDTSCVIPYEVNADLKCRVDKSLAAGSDVFVSIHINSALPGAWGTESYYNSTNDYDGTVNAQPAKSLALATAIHNRYQPAFGSPNRNVRNSNLYVLRRHKVPATLLEIGFISDSRDLNKMISPTYQESVSKAIAQGIDDYFKKN